MARIAVTLTFIFSLLILSSARTPFDQPENGTPLKEFDSQTTIFLPSNKILESEKVFPADKESVPEADEVISVKELPESDTKTIAAIGITRPLTMAYDVSFHPINRHFHYMDMKRPFRFRFPHRCRHHGMPIFGHKFGKREISYGNDMIQSTPFRIGQHHDDDELDQIAETERSMRFPREMNQFPMMKSDEINGGGELLNKEEEANRMWLHHRRHHHHHHHHQREEEEDEKEEKEESLLKRFQKFLEHHF